jgi:hypothetical protein
MFLDLVNIALLIPLAYYAWKQQGEIDDLKMMVGYVLTLVDDEEEDVLHDQ